MPTVSARDKSETKILKKKVKSFSRLVRDLPTMYDGKAVQVSQAMPSVIHTGNHGADVRVRPSKVLANAYDELEYAEGEKRTALLKQRATKLEYYATTGK